MSATKSPSPAQVAANRANAAKSTGPRTEAGKARSRANAVKHGLAGAGVALPSEDEAAVRERFLRMQEEFAPATALGMDLVHDVALAAVRRDRCRRFLAARLRSRERHALANFDAGRLEGVDRLVAAIEANPRACRRQLLAMPEGVDRLIEELRTLVGELTGPLPMWSQAHHQRLDALFGYQVRDLPWIRPTRFSRAVLGDFEAIAAAEVADLPEGGSRATWAEDRLIEAVAAEVEALRAHRATLDPDRIAEDRADAVDLAAFDPDRDAELARRYEATAARERSRALRDFALAESLGAPDEASLNTASEMGDESGSFGAAAGCHAVRYSDPVPVDAADPSARVRSTAPRGTPPPPIPSTDGALSSRGDVSRVAEFAGDQGGSNSLQEREQRPDLGSFGGVTPAASMAVLPGGDIPDRMSPRAAIDEETMSFSPPLDH